MKIKTVLCVGIFGLTLQPQSIRADPNRNEQIMAQAARQLDWTAGNDTNRANFLVKQETIITPVALIFGYADNAAACEEISRALSQARAGTFKCEPIH